MTVINDKASVEFLASSPCEQPSHRLKVSSTALRTHPWAQIPLLLPHPPPCAQEYSQIQL